MLHVYGRSIDRYFRSTRVHSLLLVILSSLTLAACDVSQIGQVFDSKFNVKSKKAKTDTEVSTNAVDYVVMSSKDNGCTNGVYHGAGWTDNLDILCQDSAHGIKSVVYNPTKITLTNGSTAIAWIAKSDKTIEGRRVFIYMNGYVLKINVNKYNVLDVSEQSLNVNGNSFTFAARKSGDVFKLYRWKFDTMTLAELAGNYNVSATW